MTASNVVCIISGAFLTFLPTDERWSRLIAFWFMWFQVGALRTSDSDGSILTRIRVQTVGFALSLVVIANNVSASISLCVDAHPKADTRSEDSRRRRARLL